MWATQAHGSYPDVVHEHLVQSEGSQGAFDDVCDGLGGNDWRLGMFSKNNGSHDGHTPFWSRMSWPDTRSPPRNAPARGSLWNMAMSDGKKLRDAKVWEPGQNKPTQPHIAYCASLKASLAANLTDV